MQTSGNYPVLTAQEVVSGIKDGDAVAFSGFTPAGAAKAVPSALAEYAREGAFKRAEFQGACTYRGFQRL